MSDNTQKPILFYGRKFSCFSNFSSYSVEWRGKLWMTVEHAYQAAKFTDENIKEEIRNSRSAHDSKKVAWKYYDIARKDLDDVRLEIMEEILRAKLSQHPHIQEMLKGSGDREIIEDSPKDAFWGWGPNGDGENHLGKIWMKLRGELLSKD